MTGTDQQSQQYDMKVQEMNSMISGTLNKILQELQNAKPKTSIDSANANKERAEKEAHKKTFNGIKEDAKEIKLLSKTYLKGTFDLLSHKTIGLGAISSNVDIIKKGSIKAFGEIKGALSEITNYSTRIEAKSIVIDNKINDITGAISSQSNLMTDVSKRIDDNANDAGEAIDYIADQLKKVEDQTSPERSTEEIKKAVDERIDKLSKGLESKSREAQDDQEIQDQRRRFTFKESMDNVKDDIKDRFLSLKDSMSENFSKLFTKPKDTVKKAGGIIAKLLKMAGAAVLGYMLVKKIVSWIQENPEEVEKFKEVFTKVIIPKVKELWGEHITPIWDFIWKGDGNTESGKGGLSQYFTWDAVKTAASFVWEGAKKNVDVAKYGVLGALLFLGKGGLAAKLTLSYLFGNFMVDKADDLLEEIGFGPDTIKNKLLGEDGKLGLWGTIGTTTLGLGTFLFGPKIAGALAKNGLMAALRIAGGVGSFLFGPATASAFLTGGGGLLAALGLPVAAAGLAIFLGYNLGQYIKDAINEAGGEKTRQQNLLDSTRKTSEATLSLSATLSRDDALATFRRHRDEDTPKELKSLGTYLQRAIKRGDMERVKELTTRAIRSMDSTADKKRMLLADTTDEGDRKKISNEIQQLEKDKKTFTQSIVSSTVQQMELRKQKNVRSQGSAAGKKAMTAEFDEKMQDISGFTGSGKQLKESEEHSKVKDYKLKMSVNQKGLMAIADDFSGLLLDSLSFSANPTKRNMAEKAFIDWGKKDKKYEDIQTYAYINPMQMYSKFAKMTPEEQLRIGIALKEYPEKFDASLSILIADAASKGKINKKLKTHIDDYRYTARDLESGESKFTSEQINTLTEWRKNAGSKGWLSEAQNKILNSGILSANIDSFSSGWQDLLKSRFKYDLDDPSTYAKDLPQLYVGGTTRRDAVAQLHTGEAVVPGANAPESKKWVKLFVNEVKDMLNGKDDGVGAMKDVDDKMDRTMELSQANLQITTQGLGGVVSAIKNSHDSISRKVASITEESYNLKDVRHG
jgi:hypothetical protein